MEMKYAFVVSNVDTAER